MAGATTIKRLAEGGTQELRSRVTVGQAGKVLRARSLGSSPPSTRYCIVVIA